MAEASDAEKSLSPSDVAKLVQGVSVYLDVEAPRAEDAVEWYQKVLGYELVEKQHWPKRKAEQEKPLIMHASLKLGNHNLMLADHAAEDVSGVVVKPPTALKGTTFTLTVETTDPDTIFKRALAHGATATLPLQDMEWGHRYGKFVDPFGFEWALVKNLEQEKEKEGDGKAQGEANGETRPEEKEAEEETKQAQ